MRRSDSGAGYGKAIFVLAILAAFFFVAAKTVPVYFHNFELQDYIRQLAVQATVMRANPNRVRDEVIAHAHELDLPLSPENVKVSTGYRTTIQIDYTVPVDLKVYTWNLHFTPSADNRSIL